MNYSFQGGAEVIQLGLQGLQTTLSNAVLVHGDVQLTLALFVQRLQFLSSKNVLIMFICCRQSNTATYGQLERLLLDGLLHLDVALVGNVQGHFQFGDGDLQLLADALHFGLEPGLSLDETGVELVDFDGHILPAR
jgi:hypothetical protein